MFGWLALAGRAPIGRHALVGCKSQCVGGSLCREVSVRETVCWWELNQSVAVALFGQKEFCGSYVGCAIFTGTVCRSGGVVVVAFHTRAQKRRHSGGSTTYGVYFTDDMGSYACHK